MQSYRGKNFKVDIEVTIKMRILKEVDLGLKKESIQIILEGVNKGVLDLDQI